MTKLKHLCKADSLFLLHYENRSFHPSSSTSLNTNDVPERQLGPAYLCFLDPSASTGYTTRHVSTWAQSHGNSYPNYMFTPYTRLQFYTIISGDPSLPSSINARRQAAAEQDMGMLIQFAIRAAKTAGIDAFWIDYECIHPEEDEDPDKSIGEVYRICDIVRACHSMAIVVGPRFNFTNYTHDAMERGSDDLSYTKTQWLRDWGSHLWTVPEALLYPGEHRISIYTPGTAEPELVAKRNLPGRVWDDAIALRQLIDHYKSSIHLTKLELISIALECLKRRQTEKRMAGDVAYALQGLLRQRPRVIQSDSDFQAFARLSLANDSDMLLERLLCLKLKDNRAPWHEMQDTSEVVENNAVTLGDAKRAMVNWEFLEAIDYEATRPQKFVFIISAAVMSPFWSQRSGRRFDTFFSSFWKVALVVFLANAIIVPWVVRCLYKSLEVHQVQARLYGVAGHPNLGRMEELMFGSDQGRLQWMKGGDSVTDHPDGDEYSYERGLKLFTLIDTCTLSAISFEAELPPSVVLAGARAGGLVRMLLCSYDANTATLCKEAVVWMETVVLDRMPKLNRVRFALKPTRDDLIAERR
ncbi:putative 3-hydroxyisobutyrate dehydrogenase protein [Botrytis fragariae]|uniref:Putative 3-hydroxyisobutyrate dehydrogenase protein n=1 Tax=Botrytis fragariae TaxID=1964551 RepID=A0A8H6AWU6_9HELO|nr:putative 3-hydroxyisobutyrate dehydrogenase protein [Botrytis fragariae]KAF5874855.1 putative 3-hydroxyisobutyrate dehydrogenase protein [Botrytis fragariae]